MLIITIFNNINFFRPTVVAENENITINEYKPLDYGNSSALFMHQVRYYKQFNINTFLIVIYSYLV